MYLRITMRFVGLASRLAANALFLACSMNGCGDGNKERMERDATVADTGTGTHRDATIVDTGLGTAHDAMVIDTGMTTDGSLAPTEPSALAGITAAHNEARANVGVGPLVWDSALAASAQAWADSCTDNDAPHGFLDHNDNRSNGHPWYVGENVYASSNPANAAAAVALWVSEMQHYNYDSNSCAVGTCQHYTQVVWAASTHLGCGISNCPGLTFRHSIVCDYGPGGNTGGKPY